MRQHRFLINEALAAGPLTVRNAGLRNQLANVLRIQPGEAVVLCDGRGKEATATLVAYVSGSETAFTLAAPVANAAEPRAAVTLYCAVLKRENFELVVQKATETGATRIVPLLTRRTVKTGLRTDRLVKIAAEATEQSGRGVVPTIEEPMKFSIALTEAAAHGRAIIFELGGMPLAAAIAQPARTEAQDAAVFIGPEGGWDEAEIAEAREKGLVVASLGPRVLRAETAAIIATHAAAMLS